MILTSYLIHHLIILLVAYTRLNYVNVNDPRYEYNIVVESKT